MTSENGFLQDLEEASKKAETLPSWAREIAANLDFLSPRQSGTVRSQPNGAIKQATRRKYAAEK